MKSQAKFQITNNFQKAVTQIDVDALKIRRLVNGAREDLNEKNIEAVFIALQMIDSASERIQTALKTAEVQP